MTPEQAPKEVWIVPSVWTHEELRLMSLPLKDSGVQYIRADRVELMVRLAVLEEKKDTWHSEYGSDTERSPYDEDIQTIKEQLQ